MRVDFSAHQSFTQRPAAATASLIAGLTFVIFASLAPEHDSSRDASAAWPYVGELTNTYAGFENGQPAPTNVNFQQSESVMAGFSQRPRMSQ
jgi:hypothetical protein